MMHKKDKAPRRREQGANNGGCANSDCSARLAEGRLSLFRAVARYLLSIWLAPKARSNPAMEAASDLRKGSYVKHLVCTLKP